MTYKKIFFSIIFITLIIIIVPLYAFADGGVFYRFYEQSYVMEQKKQTCYINEKNGIQNMILSINVNSDVNGTDAVWIFPVPSKPSAVKINILNTLPQLSLRYVEDYYLKNIHDMFFFITSTQLIHLPIGIIFTPMIKLGNGSPSVNTNNFITLYDKVEKFGLTTELISTPKIDFLKTYLNNKKLAFPDKFNKLINNYINKDYSFVISYIENIKSINGDLGVSISFPTNKIFFPLLLTSIYDSVKFPIKIFLFGHYDPALYPEIKNDSIIHHFFALDYKVPEQLKEFFFDIDVIQYLKLTEVTLNSQSNNFKDDVWINSEEPLILTFINNIINHNYIMFVLILSFISIISSVLAGIIRIGYKKEYLLKYIILGLSNVLSIVTLSILSLILFKNYERPDVNYKKILFIALIFSIVMIILLHTFNTSFETIFRDMGDAKLPLYITFLISHEYIYYSLMFILIFFTSIIIAYGNFYNPKVSDYTIIFMIIFYLLSFSSEYYLYYTFNNYYRVIAPRSFSTK